MVRLAGLEPATHGLGIHCSIHTELQAYPVHSLTDLKAIFQFIDLNKMNYSTVTLFARFLGWSTSQPLNRAM